MSAEERAREVDESACGRKCPMCADYIADGNPVLKPATREEYRAAMARSGAGGAER